MTDVVEAEEMFTKLMGDEVNPAANSSRTTPSTSGIWMFDNADSLSHSWPESAAGKTTFASRFLPEESASWSL